MAEARYEVYRDKGGYWRWRLRAANGEIVAASEAYESKNNASLGVVAAATASAEASEFEMKDGGKIRLTVSE